jgi:Na+/melibiose symporter-like transporter
MNIETLDGLTRVLQASISPVALISGVGLLILSLTNRFGRVTDRLREMVRERDQTHEHTESLNTQIRIFHRRARLLRAAIGLATGCVLLASLQILFLFGIAVLDLHMHSVVLLIFALSLVSLIGSLSVFLVDMHLSLKAVQCLLDDAGR